MKHKILIRKFLFLFAISFLLSACSKKDVSAPATASQSLPVSYTDANISIANFEAQQVSTQSIQVSFSALYQNNISKIEVLSGSTPNQLCSIYLQNENGSTSKGTHYSFTDTNIKGETMYYMIKFTMTDNNWGYTPIYELKLK